MTATKKDIPQYLAEAQKKGAAYLIIAHDRWDHDNYPIYVMPNDDFYAKLPDGSNMQTYDEVYDMNMDIDTQLKEPRAVHIPSGE